MVKRCSGGKGLMAMWNVNGDIVKDRQCLCRRLGCANVRESNQD